MFDIYTDSNADEPELKGMGRGGCHPRRAPGPWWPFLIFGFEGSVLSLSTENHSSARAHPWNITHYITTEIGHEALLGPFDHLPFTPWCQVNLLLTQPKNDSTSRSVIIDLSWPLPPGSSINGDTLRDT